MFEYTLNYPIRQKVLQSGCQSRGDICAVSQERCKRGVAFDTGTLGAKQALWEQVRRGLVEWYRGSQEVPQYTSPLSRPFLQFQ